MKFHLALLASLALASCSTSSDPTPAPVVAPSQPLLGTWQASQVRAVVSQNGSPIRDTTTPTATSLEVTSALFALSFKDSQRTNTTSYSWQLQGEALALQTQAGQARAGYVRNLTSSSFTLELPNLPSSTGQQEVLIIRFTR